jgi:hypothetical protein
MILLIVSTSILDPCRTCHGVLTLRWTSIVFWLKAARLFFESAAALPCRLACVEVHHRLQIRGRLWVSKIDLSHPRGLML